MNIFSVLQRGNSSVREVTLTAWLSYLLDSNEDHGLSDRFFRYFVRELNSQLNSDFLENYLEAKDKSYSVVIGVEQDISQDQDGSNKIDIRVEINEIEESGKEAFSSESFILYVENKISPDSAQKDQLSRYLDCLNKESHVHKAICYLTPDEKSPSGKLLQEYQSIAVDSDSLGIKRGWLKWKKYGDDQTATILKMLRNMLKQESLGEISPITDYIKHTIKAMCFFIDDNDNFNEKPKAIRKSPNNIDAYIRKIHKHNLEKKVRELVSSLERVIENKLELDDTEFEIRLDLNTYQDFRFIQFDFLSSKISNNFKIRFTVIIESKNHFTNIAINGLSNAKGDKDKLESVSEHVKDDLKLNESSNWYLRFEDQRKNGKGLEDHKALTSLFIEYANELRKLDQYL